MEQGRKPDPKWAQYIEVFDKNGKAIGFKLPDNNFLYQYDLDGGWEDQDGKYYNAEGILQLEDLVEPRSDIDDDDEFSNHSDELTDHLQNILREEEEGIVRKGSNKKGQGVVQHPKKQLDKSQLDFGKLLEEYKQSKERLRQGLPNQLIIYFKQKLQFYEKIVPVVQNKQNVEDKRAAVAAIKENTAGKLESLKYQNSWLKQQGVFVDFSGDSYETTVYDRYWYGVVKTNPQKYLQFLDTIGKSKQFRVLQIKTFYALRSKLYLKKGQQKIKATIADLKSKIQPIGNNHTVSLLIDGLPERFPCSYVYDLVEYAGGKIEDVESVIIEDDQSATITCLKPTALLLINLEGYNHDKGEYIEITFCETKNQFYQQGKHKFYYIVVQGQYKKHERELSDTLALEPSKQELAKHATIEQAKEKHFRFVIGSAAALRRVLMFRGDSLNVEKVLPTPPK